MGNLWFAVVNVMIAAVVLAFIAAAAVIIRPIVAARNEPLGPASALAVSVGGLGLFIFLFAAAGWIAIGKWRLFPELWWLLPALAWIGVAIALSATMVAPLRSRLTMPRVAWRILPPLALLAWLVGVDLLVCFDPEFHTDALWYHLTLPHYWLTEGGLRPHPTLTLAGYPLLTEMIYMVPVSYGLPFATRVLHLAFGVGVVLAIHGYLRRQLSASAALAFAAAFFIFDPVNEVATWANTDLARTFFLVAAAASLASYANRGERRDLLVGAVLSGLAMSTTYIAIVFGNGLLTIALVAATARPGVRARRIARDLAIFWSVSAAVLSPWLVKNLIHYGQPFYGLEGTNLRLPLAQLVTDYLGFVLVAFWVLARRKSDPGERLLALYLLFYLIAGTFQMPPIKRFFLPVYAVGLMLIGRVAAPLFASRRWLEIAFPVALLAFAVAVTCYQWYYHFFDDALRFLFQNSPPEWTIIWHH